MAKRSKQIPSFFKVLIGKFTLRLRLPPLFIMKYGELLPEIVTLAIDGGASWTVKLEKDQRHHYFTKGWVKFVKDLDLKMGTFLIFRLVDRSILKVSVYGLTCCEMDLPDCKTEPEYSPLRRSPRAVKGKQQVYSSVKEEIWDSTGEDEPEIGGVKMNPQFQVKLKEHHKYGMTMYKSFATETELLDKRFAVLEGPRGRYGAVLLDKRIDRKYTRLAMTVGWNEFRRDNKIVIGDTCSFEFIPSKNVIRVKVIKSRK